MSNYDILISVLEEIFQFNQANLDLGIYRIYVNGRNNLENLKTGNERWKVVLWRRRF